MILLRVAHPPACATTLIVSLGFITAPRHLLTVEVAIAVLTLQALLINRCVGLDYPIWSRRSPERPTSDPSGPIIRRHPDRKEA